MLTIKTINPTVTQKRQDVNQKITKQSNTNACPVSFAFFESINGIFILVFLILFLSTVHGYFLFSNGMNCFFDALHEFE
jgi:hypothetical protein